MEAWDARGKYEEDRNSVSGLQKIVKVRKQEANMFESSAKELHEELNVVLHTFREEQSASEAGERHSVRSNARPSSVVSSPALADAVASFRPLPRVHQPFNQDTSLSKPAKESVHHSDTFRARNSGVVQGSQGDVARMLQPIRNRHSSYVLGDSRYFS